MRGCIAMYVLGATLGRGATSEVFAVAGRDELAIKRLHPHLLGDPRAIAAFQAELERARAVVHPNVARVHAIGDGFLVLERIHGESLAARLSHGSLAEPEVRRLGAAIADGMAAVHARGIVHRDLKPANLMLAGEVPKIVDFGIARSLAADALATGTRLGTPAYMAPEQWTTGLVAPASDVWALGVILFEAATGYLPFEGFEGGRCPQLVEDAPRANVAPALDRAIAACLSRDPARRPSMLALVTMLSTDERVTQDVGDLVVQPRRRWRLIAATALATSVAAVLTYSLLSVPGPAVPYAWSLPAGEPEPQPELAPTTRHVDPIHTTHAMPAPRTHTRRALAAPPSHRAGETLD
ncbi:MAG: serine/threonine-protein kinase [Kofleriaceae bacterium]